MKIMYIWKPVPSFMSLKTDDTWKTGSYFKYDGGTARRRQLCADRIPFGRKRRIQTGLPSEAVGKNRCHAHVQCDSIIMDHAEVSSIPEINAKHVDAAIIHEAAIGRINDEQLIKLRTLGMTEEEAEGVIIENFLN